MARRFDLTATVCLDTLGGLPEERIQQEETEMTEPPRHPGTDGNGGPDPERSPGGASRWMVVLGVTIAIALFAMIVLLHVTGTIGPGAH